MTGPLGLPQRAHALPHRSARQSRRGKWVRTWMARLDGVHPQVSSPVGDPRALSGHRHSKSLTQRVREKALEDVVMMNVDSNTLETPFDDVQALPPDVVSDTPFRPPAASGRRGAAPACSALPPCPPGVSAEAAAKEGRAGPRGRGVPSLPQSPGPALRGVPRCASLRPGELRGRRGRDSVGP